MKNDEGKRDPRSEDERLTALLSSAARLPGDGLLPAGFDARFLARVRRQDEARENAWLWFRWRPLLTAGALALCIFVTPWKSVRPPAPSVGLAEGLIHYSMESAQGDEERTRADERTLEMLGRVW
jgi:hypothetical protein